VAYIRISPQDVGVESEEDLDLVVAIMDEFSNGLTLMTADKASLQAIMTTRRGTMTLNATQSGLEVSFQEYPRLTGDNCPYCSSMVNVVTSNGWHCRTCDTREPLPPGKNTKFLWLTPPPEDSRLN